MKRFLTVVVIGILALGVMVSEVAAWGGHRGHRSGAHVRFFFAAPVYPVPTYYPGPYYYGCGPYWPCAPVYGYPVVIWNRLSDYDRSLASQSTYQALETTRSGESVQWRDPDIGVSGTVSPQPAYQGTSGAPCREFQQTVMIAGQQQVAYGTACRQPDGSWRVIR